MAIDPVVTADAARVLRVPGTHNHKDSPPSEVGIVGSPSEPVVLSVFAKAVAEAIGNSDEVLAGAVKTQEIIRGSDSLMQALTGNFVSRFKTIMLRTLNETGCAQLGDIVLNQENVTEPLWRAGLSIAKFCVDGKKAIHKLSDKHPEHSPEATERSEEHTSELQSH